MRKRKSNNRNNSKLPHLIRCGSKDIIGLKRKMVKILPYNPLWKQLAIKEKNIIKRALRKIILDIQHVGSTAIPGMSAKPIIDINIAIISLKLINDLIKPLKKLGYRYFIGEPEKRLFVKGQDEKITYHLHILELDSSLWGNDLLFRDFLRENKESAKRYAELKIKLAKKFYNKRYLYSKHKSNLIELLLVEAKNIKRKKLK